MLATPSRTQVDLASGQAAEAQARAFKESANFGAIIVTKMDGHAKGGGAISAYVLLKSARWSPTDCTQCRRYEDTHYLPRCWGASPRPGQILPTTIHL